MFVDEFNGVHILMHRWESHILKIPLYELQMNLQTITIIFFQSEYK